MGIGRLLSFVRSTKNNAKISEVKLNPGGGNNITAEHFSDIGDDSRPLKNDYLVYVYLKRSGGMAVVGYLDTKNEQKANAGDKRIYSRNSDGDQVSEAWLKNDGSISLNNDNGSILLQANGEININGVRITTDGQIITAAGINVDTHIHPQANDSAGNTEQDTGAAQ